jgi:hypothetical protein
MSTALPPPRQPEETPAPPADVDSLPGFDPAKWEPDMRSMTRIVLRPMGLPMPLGFFTVAIDGLPAGRGGDVHGVRAADGGLRRP